MGGAPYLDNVKHLRRTRVSMHVGKPLIVRPLDHKATRDELRAITEEMMYSLAALLPPNMHGRYADVGKFAPRYLLPYHGAQPKTKRTLKGVMPLTN